MEKYMAESYSGRILIELIQNADDCESKRILIQQVGDDFYFANNGKPFDENDVKAICRSGSSFKQRDKSIGYRGIGFKSSTALSTEIIIYSSNTLFTFSKSEAARQLCLEEQSVPVVRIPFLVKNAPKKILDNIHSLIAQGYTSIFVFHEAKLSRITDELKDLNPEVFLFLRYIENCQIHTNSLQKKLSFKRVYHPEYETFSSNDTTWRIIRYKTAAFAFKEEDGHIVPCNESEAVYHSFLPTLDKTPFLFKINSNFSTDPSRKHISIDINTDDSLDAVTKLYLLLLISVFNGTNKESQLLNILYKQFNHSSFNLSVCKKIKQNVEKTQITLKTGCQQYISEYYNLPEWLDNSEKIVLRTHSKALTKFSLPSSIYLNNYGIEIFFSNYSNKTIDNSVLLQLLNEPELVASLSSETIETITKRVVQKASLDNRLYGKEVDLSGLAALSPAITDTLARELTPTERNFLSKSSGLELDNVVETTPINKEHIQTASYSAKIVSVDNQTPVVSKWRSAEQQVVQIERFLGNTAKDVSKMNVGYDVESTTPSGEKRYIEVKYLARNKDGFIITNNEYTTAHHHGNNYYLCLMSETQALYIQNPLNTLHFEKRVRQWEWFCEQYENIGETISFTSE